MPADAPGQEVLYSCSNCDWSKQLDSFSVELATGTCPQCTDTIEWCFVQPPPPKTARVVEITDEIELTPPGQSEATATELPASTPAESPPAASVPPSTSKPADEPPDASRPPPQKHTLRLVILLLLLGGLVFTHMVLTSDPEKAWGVFVELFPQASPAQIQAQELREVRERQNAETDGEEAKETVAGSKPAPSSSQ
ncbi:MAG: hypothetical protein HN742_33435 [Lentisphaerae bacterium]|jgi:hypothetical protein|nr:hypothetical protein [Lentisphaerota bacterium]MBT4816382.1 hypothetical protein [Lentisphaerota bacterium]MBT5611296.1 hypothetical protein [Lentisphaerota bacterium]MBT7058387.1 hypothetical protein [Lentisphaerota bacterium]MBT7846822.1 hypothetical protein [Lentisphaerota bacterium]